MAKGGGVEIAKEREKTRMGRKRKGVKQGKRKGEGREGGVEEEEERKERVKRGTRSENGNKEKGIEEKGR